MTAVLWLARALFAVVFLWQFKNFVAPEANRQSALRRYEKHPWMASETFRSRLREASLTRLRISALLQMLIAGAALLFSFRIS